jgi:EPS-associated MarR family transcriptional regulator
MSSRQKKLQEDTEFRVLRMLEAQPDATQRDLAAQAGISIGALNYCMKALIFKGWVKMQNFSESKNKFGYIYVLTPLGLSKRAQLAQAFLKRKLAEYEALQQEIERLKADLQLSAELASSGEMERKSV